MRPDRRRGARRHAAGLALALACAAGALVSGPAQAQPAPLRLLVWINGDKGYNGLQKVGDRFAAESGVQVVVQHPEGAPDKFQALAAAGKGPDIFCWPHDRVGEWAQSGLIVPIRPPRRIRDEIEPSAWSAFEWKGQTWGYPLAIEAVGLQQPDLLILDLHLPDLPGIKVAEVLQQQRPQAKLIVLSGQASSFVCPAELQPMLHAVVDKTSAFQELRQEIGRLLGEPMPAPSPAPTPPEHDSLTRRELEVLAAMGFTDAAVVLPLLQEHVGVPVSLCPELNGIPPAEGMQNVVGVLLSRSGLL